MNGEPLPLEHGFPVRMVVPGLYGYVSATKWLVDLEVTRFADFKAYWTTRGYSVKAPIKTSSRIDVPDSFAQVKAGTRCRSPASRGRRTAASSTVEVRVDGGAVAGGDARRRDNIDTWRQWVWMWDGRRSGNHTLEVRATDDTGYTQTAEARAHRAQRVDRLAQRERHRLLTRKLLARSTNPGTTRRRTTHRASHTPSQRTSTVRNAPMRTTKRIAAAAAIVSALTMTAACGGGGSSSDSERLRQQVGRPVEQGRRPEQHAAADPAADLVGPGCAAYAKQVPNGSGSVEGMAADPVAVAASNNPLLKTLTAAVSGKYNPKVEPGRHAQRRRVHRLRPGRLRLREAAEAHPEAARHPEGRQGAADRADLPRGARARCRPTEIAGKTLKTVEGEKLKISGSADTLKAQTANVICGGVKTANATVYLIDSVMMPPSMG